MISSAVKSQNCLSILFNFQRMFFKSRKTELLTRSKLFTQLNLVKSKTLPEPLSPKCTTLTVNVDNLISSIREKPLNKPSFWHGQSESKTLCNDIEPLHKICKNTGFYWPLFSRIGTDASEEYGSGKICIFAYFMQWTCRHVRWIKWRLNMIACEYWCMLTD